MPRQQPTLFGVPDDDEPMHTVAAHTRVLHDGTEVFVAEHVRWNRGRQAYRPRRKKAPLPPTEDQLDLF
jgi:hypothetical protein